MKNKKTILIPIFSIIIVVILVGLYFINSETKYSAENVLRDVNFSAEDPSVELKKIDYEAEELFIPIKLTEKTQQELIKAFEKSKFIKDDSVTISQDCHMVMTLNRGYYMFLDLDKKGILVQDSDGSFEEFVIEDDEGFFSILEKAVTE